MGRWQSLHVEGLDPPVGSRSCDISLQLLEVLCGGGMHVPDLLGGSGWDARESSIAWETTLKLPFQ